MHVNNAHSYSTPHGHTAASCDLSDGKCIQLGDFSASVINTTCSVLSIPSVLQSHGGKWTCSVDANQANHDTCHMTVAKVPSCNITSDQITSGLSGDDVLVLAVVATGYYCSQVNHLQLLTGRTATNPMDTTVTNITDDVFVTSVSVTELTIADVKLRFTCGTRTWDVSCDGAEHLPKRASDAETSATTASTDTNLSPESTAIVVSIPILILLLIIMTTVIYLRRRQRPVKDVGPPEMPDLPDEYGYASLKDIRGRRNRLGTFICFIPNSKASQGEHVEPE
ncbi:uncharacterized protein LOC124121864 [Haliotis rufescens]|uniref:uncharacterized protein LOC124121864 n=1 Tax=Haliotis rufescens TaxID=6454 RepID=UPI00201F4207|nr:uncharacterized protein LOC124121864 [Haliotis rufescens]